MLNRLYYAVCGHYDLTVCGERTERALDQLFAEKIRFWNVKKNAEKLSFCVRGSEFEKAKAVLDKQLGDALVSIDFRSRGLYFLLCRYRMRIGMIMGLFFGIFLIFLSTFFVWGVTIETNTTKFSERELFAFLESSGIRPGARISDVEDRNLALAFQLEHPEFIFVSFNVVGTHCTAELMERTEPPKKQEDTITSHLVAGVGGIVESVEVYNGEPMVKSGDVVDEGDLLVSGAITLRAGGYRLVQSRGKIMARTYRTFSCKTPLTTVQTVPTGSEKHATTLSVLGLDFSLFNRAPYVNYQVTTESVPLKVFDRLLPLTMKRSTYCELVEKTVVQDETTALKLCYDNYENWLSLVLGGDGEMIEESFSTEIKNGDLYFVAEVTCTEDIAKESRFNFREIGDVDKKDENN